MTRIVTVVGARPQFVKAGAVSRAIAEDGRLEEAIVHTGQHFDDVMSDIFFRELEIPAPRHNLGISGSSHGAMTGRMLEGIEGILLAERPDMVMVYGDTNSTLAGALAAAKLHIPVAHVEAGLRSFNRRMPEEINRVATDHLAALQLAPTATSIENLAAEGIVDNVIHAGDVMFDATLFAIEAVRKRGAPGEKWGAGDEPYAVCTIHRAENTDDPAQLRKVCAYLADVAREVTLIVPIHPRTREAMDRNGLSIAGATIIDPLGYFDLHHLLSGAEAVYTDSGGLQKEAYFHGKPCVTLRDQTEWTELIASGWNRLWEQPSFVLPRTTVDDYGDGHAASKVVSSIRAFLG